MRELVTLMKELIELQRANSEKLDRIEGLVAHLAGDLDRRVRALETV